MPSAQLLAELTTVFERYQTHVAKVIADLPPGEHQADAAKLLASMQESLAQLQSGAAEHNQKLAAAVAGAKQAMESAKAKAAEMQQNIPMPKPRKPRPGKVIDPLLEEKLQLALASPFGNRDPHSV